MNLLIARGLLRFLVKLLPPISSHLQEGCLNQQFFFYIFQLQIDFSQYDAAITLPEEAFCSETQASTIAYKTLNNILSLRKESVKDGDENGSKRFKSDLSVISATVFPRPRSPMMKPIKLVFNHTRKVMGYYDLVQKVNKRYKNLDEVTTCNGLLETSMIRN